MCDAISYLWFSQNWKPYYVIPSPASSPQEPCLRGHPHTSCMTLGSSICKTSFPESLWTILPITFHLQLLKIELPSVASFSCCSLQNAIILPVNEIGLKDCWGRDACEASNNSFREHGARWCHSPNQLSNWGSGRGCRAEHLPAQACPGYLQPLPGKARMGQQAGSRQKQRKEEGNLGKGFLFLFHYELARQHWVSLRCHNWAYTQLLGGAHLFSLCLSHLQSGRDFFSANLCCFLDGVSVPSSPHSESQNFGKTRVWLRCDMVFGTAFKSFYHFGTCILNHVVSVLQFRMIVMLDWTQGFVPFGKLT